MRDIRRHIRPGERVLSHTPARGVVTTSERLPDGELLIRTRQQFAEALDANHEIETRGQPNLIGDTQRHRQHVASIPSTIYRLWHSILGPPDENPKGWFARLNSSENRKFRTGGGHL